MNTVTKSDTVFAPEANKIFRLSDSKDATFNRLWLWPCKAIDATGKRTLNTGSVYIGEQTDSKDVTPDELASGDLPFPIQLPDGMTKQLRDVLIQADNAGDGVYFKYW